MDIITTPGFKKEIFSKNIRLEDVGVLAKEILSFFDKNIMSLEYNSRHALVVALKGDLGAGKTTFTKSFAQVLGVIGEINSPTFTIMKKYPISNPLFSKKLKQLIHIDAYRLAEGEDLEKINIREYLQSPDYIFFIEWPEIVQSILPKDHFLIEFEHIDEDTRKVTFSRVL